MALSVNRKIHNEITQNRSFVIGLPSRDVIAPKIRIPTKPKQTQHGDHDYTSLFTGRILPLMYDDCQEMFRTLKLIRTGVLPATSPDEPRIMTGEIGT